MKIENCKLKIKKIIKFSLFAILFVALGYFFTMIISSRNAKITTQETTATISNEKTGGRILGEEEGSLPSQFFSGNDFRSPAISFGGGAMIVPFGEQAASPEIYDLRSELLLTKSDQAVKFAISWKTNKPCLSSVKYTREGEGQEKSASEDDFGYVHSATLSPLSFSTSYAYRITIKDKWGNTIESDKLAFYTGAPNVSILDILGGAFKDLFGWASK